MTSSAVSGDIHRVEKTGGVVHTGQILAVTGWWRAQPWRMTMASPAVRITKPADLVGAIPYLLGFVPERSLVAVALHGIGRSARLGLVLRVDLPPATSIADCAHVVAGHLVRSGAGAALFVVYDDDEMPPGHRDDLICELGRCTIDVAVEVWDVLCVVNGAWRSYFCANPDCCPPGGRPVSSASPSVAQVCAVAAGLSVLPSRQALADTLKAARPDAVAAVSREISSAASRPLSPSPGAVAGRRARTVGLAERLIGRGASPCSAPVSPRRAARLLVGLADLGARDRCCQWALGPRGVAAIGLWTELTRLSPPTYAAAPATILAYVAWQQGFGALANIAIERALADDPDYSFARLIDHALAEGLDPVHCRPDVLLTNVLRPRARRDQLAPLSTRLRSRRRRAATSGQPAAAFDD